MTRLNISIENEPVATNPDLIAAVAEIPQTQVDVEKSAAEVIAQNSDIVECVSDIETGQDSIGTLSDIQEVLVEASTKTEGIDETTAVVTQIAVEAIYSRLGMKARPLPAMEVFASKHSRKVATNIAVESIGDSIKRVWEAIVKALKLMIDKIKSFIQTFHQNHGNLEKLVKIMKSRASAMEDSDNPKELPANISKIISLNNGSENANSIKCVEQLVSAMFSLTEYAKRISSSLKAAALASDFTVALNKQKESGKILDFEVNDTFTYYNVQAKMNGDKSRPVLALSHQRAVFVEENAEGFSFLTIKGIENTINVKSMEALTKKEILFFLDKVEELLKSFDTIDKIKDQQEQALEALMKHTSTFINIDTKNIETGKLGQAYVRYLTSLSGFISVSIPSELFSGVKNILAVVNASIVAHK